MPSTTCQDGCEASPRAGATHRSRPTGTAAVEGPDAGPINANAMQMIALVMKGNAEA
jgi:hypothetical protein